MIKFITAALLGTSLALTYNYFKHKETEQPVVVKETVQPKQDYRLNSLIILKDTDKRVVCFYDNSRDLFINCAMY